MITAALQVVTRIIAKIFIFVIPMIENVAQKLRLNVPCSITCTASPTKSDKNGDVGCVQNKRKRSRHHLVSPAQNGSSDHNGGDIKRIKLLLDITVAGGSKVVNVRTKPYRRNDQYSETEYERKAPSCACEVNQYFLIRLFNWPSSTVLRLTDNISRWVDEHQESEEQNHINSNDRIKKSPKRRIAKGNYKKILPFFPFNLLGFSNYAEFGMPSITRTDDANLNTSVNGNGKARPKRRRDSSTEDDLLSLSFASDGEQGISHVEQNNLNGHDEVDSDETADTVTKQVSSSSSDLPSSSSKNFVVLNNSGTCGQNHDDSLQGESYKDGVGEETRVLTFLEELDEAANESYCSEKDPEYKPSENISTTDDSSFRTDSCASDESFVNALKCEAEPSELEQATSTTKSNGMDPSPSENQLPDTSTIPGDEEYKTPGEEEDYHP